VVVARSDEDTVDQAKIDFQSAKDKYLQSFADLLSEFEKSVNQEIENLNSAKSMKRYGVRQRIDLKETYAKDLKNFIDSAIPPSSRQLKIHYDLFSRKLNAAKDAADRRVTASAEVAGKVDLNEAKKMLDEWDKLKETWPKPRAALADDKPWITLFNGKDLNGWNTNGGSGVTTLSVENGILTGRCNNAATGWVDHLVTNRKDFENFRLQYELMIDGNRLIAPMMLRVDPSVAIYGGMRGYILRFFGTGPATIRAVGKPVGLAISSRASADLNIETAAYPIPTPAGKWLKVEILVKGNRIRATIDGREVLDFTDPGNAFEKGAIALVFLSDIVAHYRNIRVQELPKNDPVRPKESRTRWVLNPYLIDKEPKKRWHERWCVFQRFGDSKSWICTINKSDGFERYFYRESARTDSYVELTGDDPNAPKFVRLFNDKYFESQNGVDFVQQTSGKWE
jgi:hypothetical protein